MYIGPWQEYKLSKSRAAGTAITASATLNAANLNASSSLAHSQQTLALPLALQQQIAAAIASSLDPESAKLAIAAVNSQLMGANGNTFTSAQSFPMQQFISPSSHVGNSMGADGGLSGGVWHGGGMQIDTSFAQQLQHQQQQFIIQQQALLQQQFQLQQQLQQQQQNRPGIPAGLVGHEQINAKPPRSASHRNRVGQTLQSTNPDHNAQPQVQYRQFQISHPQNINTNVKLNTITIASTENHPPRVGNLQMRSARASIGDGTAGNVSTASPISVRSSQSEPLPFIGSGRSVHSPTGGQQRPDKRSVHAGASSLIRASHPMDATKLPHVPFSQRRRQQQQHQQLRRNAKQPIHPRAFSPYSNVSSQNSPRSNGHTTVDSSGSNNQPHAEHPCLSPPRQHGGNRGSVPTGQVHQQSWTERPPHRQPAYNAPAVINFLRLERSTNGRNMIMETMGWGCTSSGATTGMDRIGGSGEGDAKSVELRRGGFGSGTGKHGFGGSSDSTENKLQQVSRMKDLYLSKDQVQEQLSGLSMPNNLSVHRELQHHHSLDSQSYIALSSGKQQTEQQQQSVGIADIDLTDNELNLVSKYFHAPSQPPPNPRAPQLLNLSDPDLLDVATGGHSCMNIGDLNAATLKENGDKFGNPNPARMDFSDTLDGSDPVRGVALSQNPSMTEFSPDAQQHARRERLDSASTSLCTEQGARVRTVRTDNRTGVGETPMNPMWSCDVGEREGRERKATERELTNGRDERIDEQTADDMSVRVIGKTKGGDSSGLDDLGSPDYSYHPSHSAGGVDGLLAWSAELNFDDYMME